MELQTAIDAKDFPAHKHPDCPAAGDSPKKDSRVARVFCEIILAGLLAWLKLHTLTASTPASGVKIMQFWVEKTYVAGRPDRQQGEFAFGAALWSPQSGSDGRDTYRLMRDVKPGDIVFHLVDRNAVIAVSVVAEERKDSFVVPNGTQWPAGKPAYFIPLKNFTKLAEQINRADYLDKPEYRPRLQEIAASHDSLFFDSRLELRQGAYLTIAPPALISIWDEIYSKKTGKHLPLIGANLVLTPPPLAAPQFGALAESAKASHWIFQGNPEHFDIDAYLQSRNEITWTVRQSKNQISEGDKVLFWKSGANGGVIAEGVVISKPSENILDDAPELWSSSKSQPDGELRCKLRVVTKFVDTPISRNTIRSVLPDLGIIKFPNATNFQIERHEYDTILSLPKNNNMMLAGRALHPVSIKPDKVKEHLVAFKQEAAAWFAKATFVKDYFEFFHTFFLRENLEKAEWPDIQQIGDHLHCFQSMALAKARAVGKPNHSIEHYRKSFIYLAHGAGEPAERIRKFCFDEEYRILGFGKSAFSELVGYLFPDEFMFVNSRDKFAAEFLGIEVEKQSGDDLVSELEAFSKAMRPVAKLYEEIVGKQTALPLNLEVDQFFSWLYENNESEIPKKLQIEPLAKYSKSTPDPARIDDDDADIAPQANIEQYDKSKAMDGLFLAETQFDEMLDALKEKKNVVLQGAPGVGKTFVAKRLAYALNESNDQRQVEMIQFHQSYSYEDFIQGFRPAPSGHFDLKFGIFYQFCRRAQRDEAAKKPYVFIIDEINRGNLSKIFGELMMLIEPDKRGKEHAIPLAYSQNAGERFYIPENLHLIGMMNTADRSLAMVDYALRRRFRFITLRPEFSSAEFGKFLAAAGATPELTKKIVSRMNALNDVIAGDTKNLGPGYQIGHSYFCPRNGMKPSEDWYHRVIESEIVPLIQEYWFDNEQKVKEQRSALLA